MTSNRKHREVVVITGASAGVGRAIVREFAKHGASVGLISRGRDGLEAAAREVEAGGGRALVLPLDVSDPNAVEQAAERVERELGEIDIWINDAMVSVFSPVMEMKPEEYKRVTEVTYLGYIWGAQTALRRMLPRNRGTLIFIGSALAYRGIPLQSAYCGAKHAIQGFFDSLRCELLHYNTKVHLGIVELPGVNTPQFDWVKSRLPNQPRPLGSCYQPEVIARAVYWAAHHRRREVYVGTSTVVAVVGNKLSADAGDHYLARVGFKGQQTNQPVPPDRRDNLWEPVPGDHGAHGRFDNEAYTSSFQLKLDLHRGLLSAIAAGVAAVAFAAGLLATTKRRKPVARAIKRGRDRIKELVGA